MRIVKPSCEMFWRTSGAEMLKIVERAGRTSYKSEALITNTSSIDFVKRLIKRGHLSVLEHVSVSAKVVCDRGVSHEIVRHRIASYTQESTRYCNYSQDRFGSVITFIMPSFFKGMQGTPKMRKLWMTAMETAEHTYLALLDAGAKPEDARSVLPNSLKTEIYITMNLREWRHFFALRTAPAAHPDMRILAQLLLKEFRKHIRIVFDDINTTQEE